MKQLAIIFILLSITASPVFAEDKVFVQVRESKVRAQPKIWASPVASLLYGDALIKLDEEGGWAQVKTVGGKQGFIPSSSLSARTVVLESSNRVKNISADPTEAILAGKGFDQEVERMFAAQSSGNFTAVNQMERVRIADSDLRAFVASGSLTGEK